jgi:hypothetical protein
VIWLSPLWLAALAALAVPLFIHLRRQRIGRRIQVGSVRHLAGAAMPRRRRLRLRDPWLLALRCAILGLVALALAEPAISRTERPAGWVLVAPSLLGDSAILRSDPVLDSLRRTGTAVRSLSPGFPTADLRGPSVAPADTSAVDLWSLLGAADQALPAGSSIVAVVPAELSLARGRRPALATRVTIRRASRPAADSVAIEQSWTRHDSVFRVIGSLRGGGMRRRIEVAPRTARDTSLPPLDSTTIRIAAGPGRADDARYLRAAFGAASDLFGAGLSVEITPPAALSADRMRSGDWTAWLDTNAPPALPGRILADAGAAEPRTSDGASARPATDAFGRPLLTRLAGAGTYRFGGRFNPRFGDFVLRDAFPELIARVWSAATLGIGETPSRELRSIDPSQLEPARGARHAASSAVRSLRNLLLAAAACLFLLERWLAHRRRA